jgi:hypothetical protein
MILGLAASFGTVVPSLAMSNRSPPPFDMMYRERVRMGEGVCVHETESFC